MITRRILTMIAPALLAGAAVIATAPAASAHASAVGSSPSADEVVAVAPAEVEVQFDSGLLEMGAALVVRSTEDQSIVMGEPIIGENTLTVPVDPQAPPGDYAVAYRVVSADGHTVKGSFLYTVAGPAPSSAGTPLTEPGAEESAAELPLASTPADSGGSVAEAAPSVDSSSEGSADGSSTPLIAIGLGIGLLVVLGIGGALLLRR